MLSSPPEGFIDEQVYLDDSLAYRHAHQFILSHSLGTARHAASISSDPGRISSLSRRQSADQALDILLDNPNARWA